MKRIVIPIETKVREFDGKLWLAANLASDGHKVAIGDKGHIYNMISGELKPDHFIIKSLSKSKSRLEVIRQVKNSGGSIGYLDTEGSAMGSQDRYLNGISTDVLHQVDQIYSWGEMSAEPIRNNTGYNKNKIYVTGNPRFDLLRPELREIYNEQARLIKEEHGDFILVNTNFNLANHYTKNFVELNEGSYRTRSKARYIYQKELLEKLLIAIEKLATNISDHTIIIRPHPAEKQELYKNYFKHKNEVLVKHQGDVREWIFASECVIQNGCTTGIESAMMNKHVIAFDPPIQKGKRNDLPNNVSISAEDTNTLIKEVESAINESNKYKLSFSQKQNLERYFANVNQQAAPEILKLINDIDSTGTNEQYNSPPLKHRAELWFKRRKKSRFVRKIKPDPRTNLRLKKFPGLTLAEIQSRLNDFEKVSKNVDLHTERINYFDDVFWIQK